MSFFEKADSSARGGSGMGAVKKLNPSEQSHEPIVSLALLVSRIAGSFVPASAEQLDREGKLSQR